MGRIRMDRNSTAFSSSRTDVPWPSERKWWVPEALGRRKSRGLRQKAEEAKVEGSRTHVMENAFKGRNFGALNVWELVE